MTAEWPIARLGELIDIKHGFAFKGVNFTEVPGPWVLLTPGNFATGGGFKLGKLKYYEGEVPSEYVLSPGELIVTMTDLSKNMDTLGFPAWVPDFGTEQSALHNQRLGRVLRKSVDTDLAYLYYLMRGKEYRQEVQTSASGSTVHHTSPSRILAFEFPLPPLEEQRGIAATLGALDDKIDSNRRVIELLDELARIEFRRWRQTAALDETSTFGDFVDVYGGATPKTKVEEYWGGDLAWTTPTDVTGLSAPYLFTTSRKITQEGLGSCTAVMHPTGTIFMTSRATIGAFAINQVPAATNQGFIAVRPRQELHRWFLFEEMRSRVDEFIGNANGSTFLEISRGRFKALPVDVPTIEAVERLHAVVDPLHTKAAQCDQENQKLADLRDALLPELLSGRIRVPEAAQAVAAASS